jgi:hypothetical protein
MTPTGGGPVRGVPERRANWVRGAFRRQAPEAPGIENPPSTQTRGHRVRRTGQPSGQAAGTGDVGGGGKAPSVMLRR